MDRSLCILLATRSAELGAYSRIGSERCRMSRPGETSSAAIVESFLASGYRTGRYSQCSLDRQLAAFLFDTRSMSWVFDDDATYNAVYAGICAHRDDPS
ncbi:hypothetical protein [Antrihabitans cavernicola]|uniref:Uncharacterized protein n=1 Tax=Antrihabitans cavernicola TaxID=2495913 RepID=A0A5A7S4U2_9NOCA|nr:hypothetical protein [Spelaeibacter cavernicola]KAA0017008.1 hypothetical protein FOY51_25540 [Spelaeibacter cavernicola]